MFKLLPFILLFLCSRLYSSEGLDSTLIDSSIRLNNIGVEYFFAGDYINASTYYEQSLRLKKQIYSNKNISIANSYTNLGVLKMNQWNYQRAIELFSEAEIIYRKFGNTAISIANVYSNIGATYRLLGDYTLSERYYLKALSDIENMNVPKAIKRKAEIIIRYGVLENDKGNYDKAIEIITSALIKYKDKIDPNISLALYTSLYTSYEKKGDYLNAADALDKALKFIEINPHLPLRNKAKILQGMAKNQIKTNKFPEALANLKTATGVINSLNVDSIFYLDLYDTYSSYYRAVQNYPEALSYFQKTIQILTKQKTGNIYITPKAHYYNSVSDGISVLKSKVQCLLQWFHLSNDSLLLNSSLHTSLVAVELIDLARNGHLSVESKILLAENETTIYEMGIYCANKLYKLHKNYRYLELAFYFAEKSKSSVLSSVLQEEKAKSFSNIPDSLLKEEQNLKKEITFYKERIYKESIKTSGDRPKIVTWNNYLFTYTQKQDKLRHLLETKYPDYYTLKYIQKHPNIKDIQKLIDKKTSIIEYMITDTCLYVFHIRKKDVALFEVGIDSNFVFNTYKFLNVFRNFSFISQDTDNYSEILHSGQQLYSTLLAPFQKEALNTSLIIIPDDILSYIPFEALLTTDEVKDIDSYSQLPFLVKKHAISYSYSASLLFESWSGTKRKVRNKVLSVAPDYEPKNTQELMLTQSRHSFRDELQPIPYAIAEAQKITALTGGDEFIRKGATEERFSTEASKYDILHLAMHTIIDDNNPLYSKLVFYDKNYSSDNGLLTTNEIFGLDLKARMTVLSSCSSGRGEIKKGEGVMSLARGFFYAGCPSLIMTLWQVEDESGLLLMRSYYKYLIKGYSKPRALQHAKIDYINSVPNEKRHPFFWSTYICIGNPTPIYFPRSLIYGLLSVLVFVSAHVIYKLKNRKKHFKLIDPAP